MSRFFNFKKKGKKEKDDPSKIGTQPVPSTQSAPERVEDEPTRDEEVEEVKADTISLKYLLTLVESYLKTVHVDPTPTTTATTDSITVGSNFATNSLPKEKKKRSLTRRATIAAASPPVLTSSPSSPGKSFFSLGSSKNKVQVIHQASFQADLLKVCCDASNSSSLRQCALWLLNFGNEDKVNQLFVSQTNSEGALIQNFIKLNIIQGDSATSQLSSRLLKRASKTSPALRKIISSICDEVLSSVSSLDQCRSSSSLEEVVGLIKHCPEESTFKFPSGVVELLYSLGQKLYSNRSPYYCMLRSRYGIDGTPLEAQLFEPPQSCLGDDITTFRAKGLPAAENVVLPFINFTVIKDSKVTSNFTNATTGVHTVRISSLSLTKNAVLLDCGQLSLLTMVELRVSLPYSIQHCVTVECAIDPSSPIKLKQQTEKNTATKFLIILPAPQLCRFLKINIDIFPEVATSPPPGFCEIALTPRGIHHILSNKSDQYSSSLQSKLSQIHDDLTDKRNELSSTLESAKVESDQGSQTVIQSHFKECVEAQTYNHFASQLYTSLCHFSNSQLSTEASLVAPVLESTKPSDDSKLDRWLTFARTLITLIDTPPSQEVKSDENKSVTLLSWKPAKRLFKYYCVFGPADLRQLVGNWISSQTDNLPDDWVPQILRSYFSTKAIKPGPLNMFPHKDLFELLLQMIKEDLYITVSSQLFSILEESSLDTSTDNTSNNAKKIDMSLVSWTLLLLSKIVSFGSKSKTIHPSSRCNNCGMSPIAGVRYRCSNCVNVDLCERCERKSSEIHNPYHLFLKIAKPLPLPPVTEQLVDKPDGPLLPVLYPDAPSEEFTKKKKKKSSKKLVKLEPETFSHKVQCAGCGKNPFTGFRFKCCNCMDYDLCEACEPVVQHFNTHVFLKILRPLPEKEPQTAPNPESVETESQIEGEPSKSQLPSALIPNQALIPLVLHRSLYPQKQAANASGPAKPLTVSDELKHPSLKEVMSKRNKNKPIGNLSQSLGSVSVDEDLDDEEEVEKGGKSPLSVIFCFLCDAATPSNTSIESLLLGIHIAKKIAKQFAFAEVRDDLLRHPRFGQLLADMMNVGTPFVQSSFLELLEALLDPPTYEDSEIYRKESLAADIRKTQSALRQQVSELLGKQQDNVHIEFLLELLSILTPKSVPTEAAVKTTTTIVSQPKDAWKSVSAPIIVSQAEEDDEEEAFPLDTKTTTVLLKFLSNQPLSENSVGYWWNILTLLKGADDLFLIKSPQLMKSLEAALNAGEELQTVLHDSVKDLLSWLCSKPNAAEFRGELLSKFAQHLQLLLKDDRQSLSLANVIANVLSSQTEKSLAIPVNSEQLVKILESLASSLKDIHVTIPDSRSILVGHLLKFINALMKDNSILEQVTKLVCSESSQTALLLVEWSTSPDNSAAKTKSKVDFQQPILAMIHSMCLTDEACKYFIAQCTSLIKRRVTPELVKLTLALLRNAALVEYFAIELKGYDTLVQQMLSHQTKIVTPAIPELYAVIVNQLATGTASTPQKKVKPGQLEEFHQQCEMIPGDGVLSNTFKDIAANNSYVWTKKAATKNQEQAFTVKVPYNVVLKEVTITVYNNWYVENDPSQPPLSLTLYAARAQNSVRPCGKFVFKDPQISGSIYTYKFSVTNKVVAKFFTFKLKHNATAPIAITRFQMKGHTMTNFVAAESFNISEDIPTLLAHCISFPETQAKLAKIFAEDETKIATALKLLDFLTTDTGSAIEDILYYLSQASLQISSTMLKYLLKEEMSVLQAQLIGRLCNVMDQDRVNKLTLLKNFVFQQLKRSFSVTLVPLMSALCSVIRQQDGKEKLITLSEEEVMQLYQSAVNSLEGTHMEESFLKFLSGAIQSNPSHFVSIIKNALPSRSSTGNNNNNNTFLSGRELKIVAALSSASRDCGSQLLDSGIPETVMQNLLSSLKSSTTIVTESLSFFADIGFNPLLRDWLGQSLVPGLLDSWPTLSEKHPSAVPLYIKLIRNAANRNLKTQEMIGNFLVDLIKKSKLQQGSFDFMEGMLSLQDTASVCLHHVGAKSAFGDFQHNAGAAITKKGSRHLQFNADKAGPASVDGASIVVNANPSYQYVTVAATEGFNSGTLYFEVEIGQNGGSMFVGLCDEAILNNNYLGQYNVSSESYGLMGSYSPWFYASKLTSGGKQWGAQFAKGDVIGVTVDFKAGTISYSKNGESIGEAFSGTLGENLLYPAVTLYTVNDQATFVKCVASRGTPAAKVGAESDSTLASYVVPLDCPLRFHRSEPVFSLGVSSPIQEFTNAVLDRVADDTDPNSLFKPALKLLFKGKPVSSNLPSIVGLLKNVDSDVIDLEYDVYRVKESEAVETSEFAEFAQNLGNSRITELLVQTNSFAALVDSLFEKTKGVFKKFDEQTAVWMRWLDLLRSQLLIPGYAEKFLQNKDCRIYLFNAMRGDFSLPNKVGQKWTLEEQSVEFFQPLLQSFTQAFAKQAAEDQIKVIRQQALESTLVERVLVGVSDLCGIEHRKKDRFEKIAFLKELKEKEKKEKAKQAEKKASNKNYWAKGTGYGTASDAQTNWDHVSYMKSAHAKARQQAQLLDVLNAYLDVPNDEALPKQVFDILEASCLVPTLMSYLRNDSLLDIMNQMELHESVFQITRTLTKHHNLIPLLGQLEEESSSIESLMAKLSTMSAIFVKTTEKAAKADKGTKESKEMQLAKNIIQIASDVKQALVDYKSGKTKKSSKEDSTNNNHKEKEEIKEVKPPKSVKANKDLYVIYKDQLAPHQFAERLMCNDSGAYTHHYSTRIESETTGMTNKLKRLVQEISSLANNLPLLPESSVFLRVDEERPDVMQAMITGPPGTPYSNGCFQFDIYCPNDYPRVAPCVNLETTGHGSVRFNPNLYNCGKVCLSLLGTWSGAQNEQWNEKTSTILQVLVSIQSLILVERPYFNEPGYESSMGSSHGEQASKEYSANIQLQCLKWAIVDQLKNPSPGFEDMIKIHFKLKKDLVVSEVKEWIKNQQTYNQKAMEELLQTFIAEVDKIDLSSL